MPMSETLTRFIILLMNLIWHCMMTDLIIYKLICYYHVIIIITNILNMLMQEQ